MKINTNIASLYAQSQLAKTSKAIARSLQRLSSGKRITSAKDDPAGLSISNSLEASSRAMARAIRNLNDTTGLLQTADGAMASQMDIVQRMRELAMQAANGTIADKDRASIDKEIQSLYDQFNQIARQTTFNGMNLLDGSFGTKSIQLNGKKDNTIAFNLDSTMPADIFKKVTGNGIFTVNTTGTSSSGTQTGSYADPGNPITSYQVVDWDHDGDMDFVYTTTDTVAIATNDGAGNFSLSSQIGHDAGLFKTVIADFNGDGYEDVVAISSSSTSAFVAVNDQSGGLSQPGIAGVIKASGELVSGNITDVSLEDRNGDMILDVVLTNGIETYEYYNPGNGDFDYGGSQAAGPWVGSDPAQVTSGDVDGRAGDDSVNLSGIGEIEYQQYYSVSTTAYTQGNYLNLPAYTWGMASGDIDHDGNLDLLSVNNNGYLDIHLGRGDGTFKARQCIAIGAIAYSIALADFNRDGNLDIAVVTSSDSKLRIYTGNGNGSFRAGASYSVASNPQQVLTGDFNGDGKTDVVVRGGGVVNNVSTLLSNGDGTFGTRSTASMGNSLNKMAVADFNGDGRSDLVTGDAGTGQVKYWLSTGGASFDSGTNLGAYYAAELQTGDLNGDGRFDIILDSGTSTQSVAFLSNGSGSFGSAKTSELGTDADKFKLKDINGDGILDLISTNANSSTFNTYIGRGDGTFGSRKSYFGGTTPGILTLGDFNNDGADDIVVSDGTTSRFNLAWGQPQSISAVGEVSVSTQTKAQNLLGILDTAMRNLNSRRANLGATMSRIDFADSFMTGQRENIEQGRSNIVDADFAAETAELVRNQILQQAQVSVLGQANLSLQIILQLLRF